MICVIQGETLSLNLLNKLCLWVKLPHMYRSLVWKVILGVLPCDRNSWEFVAKIRKQQYDILDEAVRLVTKADSSRILVDMLFIEQGHHPITLRKVKID
jgi:hypothetical protein